MSIYAALGHRISLLEKRCEGLKMGTDVAREAILELLRTVNSLVSEDQANRERYAGVVAFAQRALDIVRES
jgi:hypothetical protein